MPGKLLSYGLTAVAVAVVLIWLGVLMNSCRTAVAIVNSSGREITEVSAVIDYSDGRPSIHRFWSTMSDGKRGVIGVAPQTALLRLSFRLNGEEFAHFIPYDLWTGERLKVSVLPGGEVCPGGLQPGEE